MTKHYGSKIFHGWKDEQKSVQFTALEKKYLSSVFFLQHTSSLPMQTHKNCPQMANTVFGENT